MGEGDEVAYGIDAQDRFVSFNPAWDEFAGANGSPELASAGLISRRLWDFIDDDTTKHLYAEILRRVRAGHPARFTLRCDSPDRRRFLELEARRTAGLGVEFWVRTLALEKRVAQPLLEAGQARTDAAVRMCSWCNRIARGRRWVEIEEAAQELRFFESARLPLLSHGICGDCERRIADGL